MLRLAILRHAEAVSVAENGDLDRPLTPGGRGMAERLGNYFRNNDLAPDFAFVSPARRARETFEDLERGAGQIFRAEFVPALYNASIETLTAIAEGVPQEIKFLLLIGHNPGFAEFANALADTGKKPELTKMREHFPTPCLAIIDFDVESWPKAMAAHGHLEFFLTRAALAKLPAGGKR